MRKPVTIALLLTLCSVTLLAQTGSWHAYMSYYEPQQIVNFDGQLFIRASNDLYSYRLADHSITTYDKIHQLSDTYITQIALNKQAHKLLIVYENQNLDLIDANGEVSNISALYLKSMTEDKTVNNICMYQQYAYLATGFGVVKLNMQREEIAESYILGQNILQIGISDGNIYLQTATGTLLTAQVSKNLIDPHNWSAADSAPAGIFDQDLTDWNQYRDLVATLQPGGPKYNNFGFMRFKHNRLYSVGGGYTAAADINNPGTAQILQNNEWTFLQDNLEEVTGWSYCDTESIDADPTNPDHIFVSGRTGLYEFMNGTLLKAYNIDNSILESFNGNTYKDYVLVFNTLFDKQNNLWVTNSTSLHNSLLQLSADGKWTSHHQPQFVYNDKYSLQAMRGLFMDSRGYLWFVNDHWNQPSFFCYDPNRQTVLNSFITFNNQDGATISDYSPYAVAEDMNGDIWVVTNKGPFVIESSNIGNSNANVTQVKVPRNDGTNYADYLLAGIVTRCIAIDGGGRKWFGTQGNGIYLISADNMTEIHHFTTDNSPILSNNIYSLAIDNTTGQLFIGTDKGLCSYMTDATDAVSEMEKDNVYAFPNPVVAGYNGLITVRGLSMDADVKILSTNGRLIAQGRSNGGTFTWDGRDTSGRRVASGVYMVATAKKDGTKGTVCKIAIIN